MAPTCNLAPAVLRRCALKTSPGQRLAIGRLLYAIRDSTDRLHRSPFLTQFFKENAVRHSHVVQAAQHRKSADGAIQRETELLQQRISAAAAAEYVDEAALARAATRPGAAHSLHDTRGTCTAGGWAASRPPGISEELLQMAVAHRSTGATGTRARGDGSGVTSTAASSSGGTGGLLGLLGGVGGSRRSSASASDGPGDELAALFGRASSRPDNTATAVVPVRGDASSCGALGRPWLQSRPAESGSCAPASFGLGGSRPVSRPASSEPRPSLAVATTVARPAPAPSPPPPPLPLPPPAGPAGKVAQAQAVLDSAQALCNAAHGGAEGGRGGAASYAGLRDALKTLVASLSAGSAGAITPVEVSVALGSFIQVATAALGLRPHSSPGPTSAAAPALACLHSLGRFVHASHRRTYREVVVAHGFPYTSDPSEPPPAATAARDAADATRGDAGISGAKRLRDATS